MFCFFSFWKNCNLLNCVYLLECAKVHCSYKFVKKHFSAKRIYLHLMEQNLTVFHSNTYQFNGRSLVLKSDLCCWVYALRKLPKPLTFRWSGKSRTFLVRTCCFNFYYYNFKSHSHLSSQTLSCFWICL